MRVAAREAPNTTVVSMRNAPASVGASKVDWITVTPAPASVGNPFWSPDGGLVYYMTYAGGTYFLMARHLDGSRHPVGLSFRVFEFPGRPSPASGVGDLLTAVPGRFIGAMTEASTNIWMMDLPK